MQVPFLSRGPRQQSWDLLGFVEQKLSSSKLVQRLEHEVEEVVPGLNPQQIEQGLREALNVAIDTAVRLTGRLDGFYAHAVIKIIMPEQWCHYISMLEKVGFRKAIDNFILSMNRAAESAAPLARSIFIDAVTGLQFDDVVNIFKGGDTAATDFLRSRTEIHLKEVFKPVLVEVMKQHQVTELYQHVAGAIDKLPFHPFGHVAVDIEHYVAGKAVDGLLWVMAQAEKDIRHDPTARVTDLLKLVFSKLVHVADPSYTDSSSKPILNWHNLSK